jgi:thiol-disulfide isomerase/thioredoxin
MPRRCILLLLLAAPLGCAETSGQVADAAAIAAFPFTPAKGTRRVAMGLWKASFAPDGNHLVVGRIDRGLEIIDLETGARSRLSHFGRDPAWSPDGRLVAFAEGKGADDEVWVVEPGGGQPRQVAKGGFPSWSNDGKRLFFSSRPDGHLYELAIDDPAAQPRLLFDHVTAWFPAVSPDESKIAVGIDDELVVMERATGFEVARVALGQRKEALFASWAPDGKWLAVTNGNGVVLYELGRGTQRWVATGPYNVPAFSRDGRRLAFDERLNSSKDVWITDKLDMSTPKPRPPSAVRTVGKGGGPPPPKWRWRRMPLPELDLADLGGHTWKLGKLDGKVAFVNLWATWCGPCREELPVVQKLYDSLKGRSDVVLVSLNLDDDPEKARKYVAEHKLTIPVLPAGDYVRHTVGAAYSIPRSWIVGSQRLLTSELLGFFPGSEDAWLKAALAEIDRARGNKQ